MGIKKLVKQERKVKFHLPKETSLLYLKYETEESDLIVCTPPFDKSKLDKLVGKCLEAKFIGTKDAKAFISNNFPNLNLKRDVLVDRDVDIIYDKNSEKLLFENTKNVISQDNLVTNHFQTDVSSKKTVLVIDDSRTVRELLQRTINESEHFEVIRTSKDTVEARDFLEVEKPDLITLDIHMPGMNGVDFLKTYLKHQNIPTVIISSLNPSEGPLVLEALSEGAIDFIQKPKLKEIKEYKSDLLKKLEAISKSSIKKTSLDNYHAKSFKNTNGYICIGSSTGGTQALEQLLTRLPDNIPPIFIVQHIPAVFSKALAMRLNSLCPFTVKEVEDSEVITKNTVYIAQGGKQFKVKKFGTEVKALITDDAPVNRFKPSVDYLFDSIVDANLKTKVVGVILTGMGKDGAQGILNLKNQGHFTIAQDEETSVVFGMNKHAITIGGIDKILPIGEIANETIRCFNSETINMEAS